MQVHYIRVQPNSPDFDSKYHGFDQTIDIGLSTFVFSASPEPVLALYDFIMATFVPGNAASPGTPGSEEASPPYPGETQVAKPATGSPSRISLHVSLNSVQRKSPRILGEECLN